MLLLTGRVGYGHARCTWSMQCESDVNEVVMGNSEYNCHQLISVGGVRYPGPIDPCHCHLKREQDNSPPVLLDMKSKTEKRLMGHSYGNVHVVVWQRANASTRRGKVTEAMFTCGGRFVVTGGEDKTVQVFLQFGSS